jgi:hypothetical protein
MRMMALAFEIQHRVDDVLERFRPGEAAVLGDVADEKRRHVLTFRREQQLRRRLAHLADAAWRGLELEREDGLHRVDNDERGLDAGDLFENPFEAGFGQEIERCAADRQPLASRLDLVLRLFARAVKHRSDRSRDIRRRLKEQRRLANPRLAAEQHQRPGHDAAAEDAVELVDAGGEARVLLELDLRVQARRSGGAAERVTVRRRGLRRRILTPFLDERIPGAAVGAAAQPLRRL